VLSAIAGYGFADCPQLDIILVPGGIGTRREVENQALVSWLRARADAAERSDLGMHRRGDPGPRRIARRPPRDQQQAGAGLVKSQGPKVQWVGAARWVEDGKFATSSGVSAGIDLALTIIAQICAVEMAEQAAVGMSTNGIVTRGGIRLRRSGVALRAEDAAQSIRAIFRVDSLDSNSHTQRVLIISRVKFQRRGIK
jgi:transcriptional regulator GlxA family with amidase domain